MYIPVHWILIMEYERADGYASHLKPPESLKALIHFLQRHLKVQRRVLLMVWFDYLSLSQSPISCNESNIFSQKINQSRS